MKNKNKNNAERRAKIEMQPTPYIFNLRDISPEEYGMVLNALFCEEEFANFVEQRNKLVTSACQLRPASAEMNNLVRVIQQKDRKIADTIYSVIVQTNLRSEKVLDDIPFSKILTYYVDYSRENMVAKVDKLGSDLNRMMFLTDMLESLLVDIKSEMQDIFDGDIEFRQFDGVLHTMGQIKSFMRATRGAASAPVAQLYMDYADSINEYLNKRLKTYSEKLLKYNPKPKTFTENEIIDALNQYFGEEGKFDHRHIAHTRAGGCFVDVMVLMPDLSPSQTEKIDKAVGSLDINSKNINTYALSVTDAILNEYIKP